MARRNKLKFLSESILLEESGLPMINSIVIVTITALILMFILWANYLEIEESLTINGQVHFNSSIQNFEFIGEVGIQDLIAIEEGAEVYISVAGVTSRQDLAGRLRHIDTEPNYNSASKVFYYVYVDLTLSEKRQNEMDRVLITGMESRLKIVTGSKTMLQYLLGNLYETGKDTFSIK